MQTLHALFAAAKRAYDSGGTPHGPIGDTAAHAIELLAQRARSRGLAQCDGKAYSVFEASGRVSRPFLPSLYEPDPRVFQAEWRALVQAAQPKAKCYGLAAARSNRVLYTALTAFCVCYDLWKPGSRKTPGTFFEAVLGSIRR